MPNLVIHIGMYKTGTTSTQMALAQLARKRGAKSFCYPLSSKKVHNQYLPLNALLLRSPAPDSHSYLMPHILGNVWNHGSDQYEIRWNKLREAVLRSNLPVILSAENLCLADQSAVDVLRSTFQDFTIKVIATARPVSELLPSWYQELAKVVVVPDFENFVRSCLEDLLNEENHRIPKWMSTAYLKENWLQDGVGSESLTLQIVPTTSMDPRRAFQTILMSAGVHVDQTLTISGTGNASMSVNEVNLWQRHLSEFPNSSIWSSRRTHQTLSATKWWRDSVQYSGKYLLTQEAKELIDGAFPIDGEQVAKVKSTRLRDRLKVKTPFTQELSAADGEYIRYITQQHSNKMRRVQIRNELIYSILNGMNQKKKKLWAES